VKVVNIFKNFVHTEQNDFNTLIKYHYLMKLQDAMGHQHMLSSCTQVFSVANFLVFLHIQNIISLNWTLLFVQDG